MELQRGLQLAARVKQVVAMLPTGALPPAADPAIEEVEASRSTADIQSYCQLLKPMQVIV
jgi:hypothetical protein